MQDLYKGAHSIMFHHFHGGSHLPAQGSLSADNFRKLIEYVKSNFNLINANQFIEKHISKTLQVEDVCFSFDDALACQYDIAVPILNEMHINAFFFIYSSPFTSSPDLLEVFRLFRTSNFKSIDNFYEEFFKLVKLKLKNDNYQEFYKEYLKQNYLIDYPYYSQNDKWFRYIRDKVFNHKQYLDLMLKMMKFHKFDIDAAKDILWMKKNDLYNLVDNDHILGLHSDTHPTKMSSLPELDQMFEYEKNLSFLEEIVGKKNILSMSHPCGDYNEDTLKILNRLGIKLGFRSNMKKLQSSSALEIPRDSHSNVFNKVIKNEDHII